MRINNAGYRDRDRFVDKFDGVYRIAVLGDEVSEALQVEITDTWWWRRRRSQSCTKHPRVEVLNFAVNGYGTGQELISLETSAMRYQPDLVLLQFSNANDVVDNSFALSSRKLRPYRLDTHGVPRVSESFANSPAFERRMNTRYRLGEEIADHSRAFQLVRQLGREVNEVRFIPEARADRDMAILGEPRGELWEEAWRVTEALLARAKQYSERNGARFVVVAAPHPLQPVNAMAYPDQRLHPVRQQEPGADRLTGERDPSRALYQERRMEHRGAPRCRRDRRAAHLSAAVAIRRPREGGDPVKAF